MFARPLAVATTALALAFAVVCASAAAAQPDPDEGGVTPVASKGTELASKRAISRGQLRDELARAMRSDGSSGGLWVYDTDANGKRLLYSESASKPRIPASNQKLFTTAAFVGEFGPTHRLETRVYVRGKLQGRRDQIVGGDLVVVGDGDPAFGTNSFARRHNQPVTRVSELARNIVRAGVRRIKGRIRADASIFDTERRAGPYLSPLSGLSFNNGYDENGYARRPELEAVKALKRALRKRGVKVRGKVGRAKLKRKALRRKPLAKVTSPTVEKLITETNVPSNNFFAEMLHKRLGAVNGGKGTRKRGSNRVEAFAEKVGTKVRSVDGSGLSRKNRASAAQVGKLLVAMARRGPAEAAFRDSLPIAGREGTVSNRMRGTAAEGKCATKTGTLSDVSALSGYCRAGGHTIAFSALMNSANVDAARRAQDRIAALIARYDP